MSDTWAWFRGEVRMELDGLRRSSGGGREWELKVAQRSRPDGSKRRTTLGLWRLVSRASFCTLVAGVEAGEGRE